MSKVLNMNNVEVKNSQVDIESIQKVLLGGDLSTLRPEQKIQYYQKVCEMVGLNPLTKPFDYIRLNGKEVLYANKGCAEQLRQMHKISLKISSREKFDDVYVITADATDDKGRTDSSTGAVTLKGLSGESLANAMMKAETKAKRRVTLSICGLNMLDETEVASIEKSRPWMEQPEPGDGVFTPGNYVVQIGKKYKGQKIKDISLDDLRSFIRWLEDEAERSGKPLGRGASDLIQYGSEYIAGLENAALGQTEGSFDAFEDLRKGTGPFDHFKDHPK